MYMYTVVIILKNSTNLTCNQEAENSSIIWSVEHGYMIRRYMNQINSKAANISYNIMKKTEN